jgi:spectrin alpha
MKKHQLVEADIVAHEDRIKDMNDQADSLVESGQFDSSDILEKRDLISTRYKHIQAALWNRNRRNRNFLTSGTGTVINYGSGTGTRYKIMYRTGI